MRTFNTKHKQFYHPVSDDWYPNFPGNTVCVCVHEWRKKGDKHSTIRTCVWGEDDFGMEFDIDVMPDERYDVLERVFKEVDKFPNPLNKKYLKERGFVNA
mgnify:CR=1 FL=1